MKSCTHLMIAAHQIIGRARLTKRDHLLTASCVPQAPHSPLSGPGKLLFAVRFVGEPFHSLFHPQVNEGCLPQEDDMRDSLRLCRFFSEAEVILTMKNCNIGREKFQDMYSSSLGSPGCAAPRLCAAIRTFQWAGTQLLRAFPRLLFLFVWKAELHVMKGKWKMQNYQQSYDCSKISACSYSCL